MHHIKVRRLRYFYWLRTNYCLLCIYWRRWTECGKTEILLKLHLCLWRYLSSRQLHASFCSVMSLLGAVFQGKSKFSINLFPTRLMHYYDYLGHEGGAAPVVIFGTLSTTHQLVPLYSSHGSHLYCRYHQNLASRDGNCFWNLPISPMCYWF